MGSRRLWWIGAAMLASGCMGGPEGKLADAATDRFYQLVAAKSYQAIYDGAAPEMSGQTTADTFVGMMQRIDRKLGACQPPRKTMNWSFNESTSGYFRTQGYERVCANGKLEEQVTIVVRGADARLAGYQANSPLLLTD